MSVFNKEIPDWHAASCELISHMALLSTREDRLILLEKLCDKLGHEGYPAFIKILCLIEHLGDQQALDLLTDSLCYGLQTGRVPSGTLPGWGSSVQNDVNPFATPKQLGPIEYLCVWYTQPSVIGDLESDNFQACLSHLLRLLSRSADVKHLYYKKLQSAACDPLTGIFSSATKKGISKLAIDWNSGDTPEHISSYYIETIVPSSNFSQLDKLAILRQI